MATKVLVTGATGNIGSQLVQRLTAHDELAVRVLVRDEKKAAPLKEAGAELVAGTFEDAGAVRAAVNGVDTVVLITSPNANASDQASAVLAAAKEAGVRKIVRISALKADVNGPTDNTRQHGRTENEIKASGLTYTILRPHAFMQNLFMAAESIANDGKMHFGVGNGKLGMIDVRDVVDCTEKVVLSDEFDNQIFELTGPQSISYHEVAKTLSEILGRTIEYEPVPPEAVEQSMREMGIDDWFSQVMRDYSRAFSEDWGDYTTDVVEHMTGGTSRSFAVFAREVFAPAIRQPS